MDYSKMIRFFLFFVFCLYSFQLFAADHGYYSNSSSAQAACSSYWSVSCGEYSYPYITNSSICAGSPAYVGRFWAAGRTSDFWYFCGNGYASCLSVGETRDTSGSCSCPAGQSVVNGACACPAGETATVGGGCHIEPICSPPEIDNGYGQCIVSECTNGTVLDPFHGGCATPPSCSSFEGIDWTKNPPECYINKLDCPLHSHANAAGDACLPDPPQACPIGQHDDGTYKCVADDAVGCHGNTQRGLINGQLACVPKPVLDASNPSKEQSNNEQAQAEQAARDAQAVADAAQANADANPNDPAAQQAAAEAKAEAQAAREKSIKESVEASAQNSKESALQLDAIRRSLDTEEVPGIVASHANDKVTPTNANLGHLVPIDGLSSPGSCPSNKTFSVFSTDYQLSMVPACDFAEQLRPLLIAMAWVAALYIAGGSVSNS